MSSVASSPRRRDVQRRLPLGLASLLLLVIPPIFPSAETTTRQSSYVPIADLIEELRDECARRATTDPTYQSALLRFLFLSSVREKGLYKMSWETKNENTIGDTPDRRHHGVMNRLFNHYGTDRGTITAWSSRLVAGSGYGYGDAYDMVFLGRDFLSSASSSGDDEGASDSSAHQAASSGAASNILSKNDVVRRGRGRRVGRHRCDVERVLEVGIGSVSQESWGTMAAAAHNMEIRTKNRELPNQNPENEDPETRQAWESIKNYKPGGGLRAWRDFFPNAIIYGLDIDPQAMLSKENRIKTAVVNSHNKTAVEDFVWSEFLRERLESVPNSRLESARDAFQPGVVGDAFQPNEEQEFFGGGSSSAELPGQQRRVLEQSELSNRLVDLVEQQLLSPEHQTTRGKEAAVRHTTEGARPAARPQETVTQLKKHFDTLLSSRRYELDRGATIVNTELEFRPKAQFLQIFDVVIDDALHYYLPQRAGLSFLWPYLKEGGLYFVEDFPDVIPQMAIVTTFFNDFLRDLMGAAGLLGEDAEKFVQEFGKKPDGMNLTMPFTPLVRRVGVAGGGQPDRVVEVAVGAASDEAGAWSSGAPAQEPGKEIVDACLSSNLDIDLRNHYLSRESKAGLLFLHRVLYSTEFSAFDSQEAHAVSMCLAGMRGASKFSDDPDRHLHAQLNSDVDHSGSQQRQHRPDADGSQEQANGGGGRQLAFSHLFFPAVVTQKVGIPLVVVAKLTEKTLQLASVSKDVELQENGEVRRKAVSRELRVPTLFSHPEYQGSDDLTVVLKVSQQFQRKNAGLEQEDGGARPVEQRESSTTERPRVVESSTSLNMISARPVSTHISAQPQTREYRGLILPKSVEGFLPDCWVMKQKLVEEEDWRRQMGISTRRTRTNASSAEEEVSYWMSEGVEEWPIEFSFRACCRGDPTLASKRHCLPTADVILAAYEAAGCCTPEIVRTSATSKHLRYLFQTRALRAVRRRLVQTSS